jgi:hypothetical protein
MTGLSRVRRLVLFVHDLSCLSVSREENLQDNALEVTPSAGLRYSVQSPGQFAVYGENTKIPHMAESIFSQQEAELPGYYMRGEIA